MSGREDDTSIDERSLWLDAKKKLPVLCRLYTNHELSIERLISAYLHVGLLKAHRTLKDYCMRKLASIDRQSENGEDDTEPKPGKLWRVLSWVNKKLQKWAGDKLDESAEPLAPEEKNVIIYPAKLNLVIFPPSVESANEALEEDVEEEPLTADEFSQDLWDETSPPPSHRSLRLVKDEPETEKPTFSEYLKNNLHLNALFPMKTTKPPQRRNEVLKNVNKNPYTPPFVPMPQVLKQEFDKFERQHNFTPLSAPVIIPKPQFLEPAETNFALKLTNTPLILLYAVPVALIAAVFVLLCYLLVYMKKKGNYLDHESQERLINVQIEQATDDECDEGPPKVLSSLSVKGEKKTRQRSYEDDYSKKSVLKSTPTWSSVK